MCPRTLVAGVSQMQKTGRGEAVVEVGIWAKLSQQAPGSMHPRQPHHAREKCARSFTTKGAMGLMGAEVFSMHFVICM